MSLAPPTKKRRCLSKTVDCILCERHPRTNCILCQPSYWAGDRIKNGRALSYTCGRCVEDIRLGERKTQARREALFSMKCEEVKEYFCDHCPISYSSESLLATHMERDHVHSTIVPSPPRYSCSICSRAFSHLCQKIRHESEHFIAGEKERRRQLYDQSTDIGREMVEAEERESWPVSIREYCHHQVGSDTLEVEDYRMICRESFATDEELEAHVESHHTSDGLLAQTKAFESQLEGLLHARGAIFRRMADRRYPLIRAGNYEMSYVRSRPDYIVSGVGEASDVIIVIATGQEPLEPCIAVPGALACEEKIAYIWLCPEPYTADLHCCETPRELALAQLRLFFDELDNLTFAPGLNQIKLPIK
jgi:hypothetical protein